MRSRRALRAAVEALLLVVLLGAVPTVAVAAGGPAQPSAEALCAPATPGFMTCDSLISTAIRPLAKAAVTPDSISGYQPSDLLSAYQLPDGASGAGLGMTVAVVDAYDLATAEADLATYRSQWGLSACTTANGCFKKVDQNGGTSYPATNAGWNGETALDIEMVSAICPNCKIVLVEANSSGGLDLFTAESQAVSQGANVISNSWGGGEGSGEQTIDAQYLNHPGIAITFSTGDDGYGTQYPATSPYVTAVGGTSLTTAANPRGWSESAWGSSGGGIGSGAGSGCSSVEAKPSFQHDAGCAQRTIADVSAVADPHTGVAVYTASHGGWVVFGGTSVASPIIAGVYALAGPASPGTYPVTYPYAKPAQLNDVTSGTNGSCGGSYLCTGKVGYDGPTGLGTPISTGAFGTGAVPGAATSVTATAANASAVVSWHVAPPNGHPVSNYTVTSTPGGQTCSTAGTLTCTVSGLTNGTSYTFKVVATNSIGPGPSSAASNAVVPATVPSAPTGVSATPADGAAQVSWTAPASNGGKAINGYTVTAAPGGHVCTTSGSLTCSVMSLTNGTSYTFTVTATNPIGTSAPSSASSGVTPVTVPGATYYAITPTRFVDTRYATGLPSKLIANVHRTFQVTISGPVAIPANAVAVTGNLTVTGQTSAGYVSLTSVADDTPGTSTLNFPAGDVRANGVTATLGAGGGLSVTYVAKAGASTQVVFDVTGYFASDAGGATYVPVAPTRLVDTRDADQPLTRLVANVAQTLQVADLSPADTTTSPVLFGAIAVTGNLTVTGQTSAGYFSLTTTRDNAPKTSTLNFPAGDVRANGVTVPLGPGGTLGITYVAKGGAHADVVFDVTGYFVNDLSGATYVAVTPNRLVDSRQPGSVTKLLNKVAQTFDVANQANTIEANVPADAVAVTGNLTATGQTAAGYFSLTTTANNNPGTSTLNFPLGDVRANGVTITLGPGQTLSVTYVAKLGASAQVVFDVTGYFVQ